MDAFDRNVLTALASRPGSSSEDLRERLDAAGNQPAGVMLSAHSIESTLFELERQGLVAQDESDAAEIHSRDRAAPTATRYWLVTDAGREALDSQ